jgi:hypothetical protein
LHPKSISNCLLLFLWLAGVGALPAYGAYPAPIKYKQTMVRVIQESDVQGWPPGYITDQRYPHDVVVSANGAKVGFIVKLNNYSDQRIYVMNADGTGLVDVTPADMITKTGNIAALQINDAGSRLFFWDYPNGNIYYIDTTPPYTSHPAYVPNAFWVGSTRSYGLNSDGSVIYLRHNWVTDKTHDGFCYTSVGSNILTPVVDVLSLTPAPTVDYGTTFLDAARTGGKMLFTYYPDHWDDSLQAMWESSPLIPMPNERHNTVWSVTSLQAAHIMSADGSKALYNPSDGIGKLYLVDLTSGAKTLIAQMTGSLDGITFPALSPDGTLARWTSQNYWAARINLATGDVRDTFSALFPEAGVVGAGNLTDITADNRYYFMSSDPNPSCIHRIDLAATGSTAPAPDISAISFSRSRFIVGDTTPVTVTVQVSDPKGLDNILSVQMHSLTNGQENIYGVPDPLTYFNPMTDAGGGTYTIPVNINNYRYQNYPFLNPVGIRIVVRNKDEHYVLADTVITVTTRGALGGAGIKSLLLLD